MEPCAVCSKSSSDPTTKCTCQQVVSWRWCRVHDGSAVQLSSEDCEVCFHRHYSTGTAAVRGDTPLQANMHHYWQMEVLTKLYGTDVMVGVGTASAPLDASTGSFSSLLGSDCESWGFSYTGKVQHAGRERGYGPGFSKGAIIGVHLDMWHGTLEFFLNRKPLGIAFRGLKSRAPLYPMVSSTAAQSGLRLVQAYSRPACLQLAAVRALLRRPAGLETIKQVPGLRGLCEETAWILMPQQDEEEVAGSFSSIPTARGMFRTCTRAGSSNTDRLTEGLHSKISDRWWGEFTRSSSSIIDCVRSSQSAIDVNMVYANMSDDDEEEEEAGWLSPAALRPTHSLVEQPRQG